MRLHWTHSFCQGMWNEQRADHFQAHSAQKVMQMQLAISHEPIMKVPWGPSVRGAGAQSPGRHAGWRYPYTHKDWDAQARPQPPPFPRGELLEMEKQECIEYPESQKTVRDEDTICTQCQRRRVSSLKPQRAGQGLVAQPTVSDKGGRAEKGRGCSLKQRLAAVNQEEAHICCDGIGYAF